MLIITVQIFSLCKQIFSYVRTNFPVFSLSGKSKNQILCFACAVATLLIYLTKIVTYHSHILRQIYAGKSD